MSQYLLKLAKQILSIQPRTSKVCFAKTIYFVHKGLILNNLSIREDLQFIRMPLGPVPVGFDELALTSEIIVNTIPTGLIYNQQNYSLANQDEDLDDFRYSEIKNIVGQLSGFCTSQLVESSHKEPTWLNHINSQRYFISNEDLKKPLPILAIKISVDFDEQKLQACLLDGMIDEIVAESTKLEYPDKN